MAPANTIQHSIATLAHHYPDEHDLLRAVRKQHPDASKKTILLAALPIIVSSVTHGETVGERAKKLVPGKARP